MQRYFDAETSPQEEKELAIYAASTNDSSFVQLRGVLGLISIGREKKARRHRAVRFYAFAVAACMALIVMVGIGLSNKDKNNIEGNCIRYAYGVIVEDDALIMASVETSLAVFFGEATPAETNLKEMFER